MIGSARIRMPVAIAGLLGAGVWIRFRTRVPLQARARVRIRGRASYRSDLV